VRRLLSIVAFAATVLSGCADTPVDPAAPFLYVVHASTAAVTVLDRRTLRTVGALHPAGDACPFPVGYSRLRLARNTNALYVIGANSFRYPAADSWVVRYDLVTPPEELRGASPPP